MKNHVSLFLSTLLIPASLALVAGCAGEEPVATETPSAVTAGIVPTFAQVQGAVNLDESDAATVKAALATWQKQARAGNGPRPEPGCDREHPMMDFVAAVAPSLDDEQLAKMVEFLVQHRETHMNQDRRGDGRGDQVRATIRDRLRSELGLTGEQVTAMDRLREQTRTKMQEIRRQFQAGTITEAEMETRMEAVRAWHREQLGTILTPEQLAKLDALREQRREQRMERRSDCLDETMAARAEFLVGALALSAEQGACVTSALTTCADQVQAAFAGAGNGDMDRDALRTRLRDLRRDCDAAINDCLGEEQRTRLQILRRLVPGGGMGPHGPGGPDDV